MFSLPRIHPWLWLCALALATGALARPAPRASGLHFSPSSDADEDRPLITEVTGKPSGGTYELHVRFSKPPTGAACDPHCVDAMLFLDMDDTRATGLQLGSDAKETGADLVVTLVGNHDPNGGPDGDQLQVKVRKVLGKPDSVEDTDVSDELGSVSNPDRVQVNGNSATIFVDASDPALPRGKMVRMIYHPPGAHAVEGTASGMQSSGKVQVIEKGAKTKRHRRR